MSLLRKVAPGFVVLTIAAAVPLAAQVQQASSPLSREDIAALAKLELELGKARDSAQAHLGAISNAKPEPQQQIRDALQKQIAGILQHSGLTEQQYQQRELVISTNGAAREIFDSVTAQLTGAPLPGHLAPATPQVKVPAGAVGMHIGHVINGFSDTPNGMGLLPTAIAEAKTALQHATLASRSPTNLDAMKLHAGHVIHAVDPTIVTTGPGLGYGVKKAAAGVATHIELAAKAAGASENVKMHAEHIATSARNTVERADQVVALAKKIQAATTADEAAKLVNQLVPLTDQLLNGFDANSDGRITWEKGEGGLMQAQQHLDLMLAAEKP